MLRVRPFSLLLTVSVMLGFWFRLRWPLDIEYKWDQLQIFNWSQSTDLSVAFPWLGMPSGINLQNPGASVWMFSLAAKLFHLHTPVALTTFVIAWNLLGLGLLTGMALRKKCVLWTLAAALAWVNPFSVLFSRVIWAQSLLPSFGVIVAWLYERAQEKKSLWAAFTLGVILPLLGQIHMSGFFFGVTVWVAFAFQMRASENRKTLLPLTLGSLIGALPLIPWLSYLAGPGRALLGKSSHQVQSLSDLFNGIFWRYFFANPAGHTLNYSLGPEAFGEYLRSPLAYLAHALSVLSLGALGILILIRLIKRTADPGEKLPRYLGWVVLGMGALLTASQVRIFRFYLLTLFPLDFLAVAYLLLGIPAARKKLRAVAILIFWSGAVLGTFEFQNYVHRHGGSWNGDYGIALRHQLRPGFGRPSDYPPKVQAQIRSQMNADALK